MKIISIFIALSLLLVVSSSSLPFNLSQPVPETCGGIWNTFGTVDNLPSLAGEFQYGSGIGQKFTIDYDGRSFFVLNLTGNPYEVGYIQGYLMKNELSNMVPKMYNWLENFLKTNVSIIEKLPSFVKNVVGTVGLHLFKVGLALTYEITKPYTPDRFNYEIQGLADSTGISVWDLRGLNMIPELLKASCSIMGVWGPASATGKLLQLRALDWESHAPLSDYPQITVYHLNEPGSVPAFANIGWPGFIGSITGYSPYIGVSERLRGSNAQDKTTRFGKPWNYALRDVLQFTTTIDSALNNLNDTKRTCTVYLGVGSSVNNTYRIIQYSEGEFEVFDDHNWFFDSNNPQMDGVLYKAYHYDACFRDIIQKYYGEIDAEVIRQITATAQTGDSQVIVMNFATNEILAGYPSTNGLPGFVYIDLNPFLQVKPQYS